MMKKLLSLLLACVLALGMIPAVGAAEADDYLDKVKTNPHARDVGDNLVEEVEPNDDAEDAKQIYSDDTLVGTMSYEDVDAVKMVLPQTCDVVLVSGAEKSSLIIAVFDSKDNLVVVSEPLDEGDGVYTDGIVWVLPAGTYYVVVMDEYTNTSEYNYLLYAFCETHTHEWDDGVVTKAATCSAKGTKTYTCTYESCGQTKTETIAATGHSYSATSTKAATCTNRGYTNYACSKCTQTKRVYTDALGHNWVLDGTVAATCDTKGYTAYTCSRCSTTKKENYTPELGHVWNDNVCSDCGDVYGEHFVDVIKGEHYFFDSVKWAALSGVTTGTDEYHFSPYNKTERCQIVTFLWRANGCPRLTSVENPFTDVSESDYFYDAVLWAVEEGITTGTSATTFSPYNNCERGQVVTFLWRANGCPRLTSVENPFTDVSESDYFYNAVLWAVENGITTGASATTFAPFDFTQRCQAVTFLYRALAD